eukprot:365747-Chlamydomonas_euryale.AAC.14
MRKLSSAMRALLRGRGPPAAGAVPPSCAGSTACSGAGGAVASTEATSAGLLPCSTRMLPGCGLAPPLLRYSPIQVCCSSGWRVDDRRTRSAVRV